MSGRLRVVDGGTGALKGEELERAVELTAELTVARLRAAWWRRRIVELERELAALGVGRPDRQPRRGGAGA